ncbi:MAG: anti-sigma factor family protein [Candidatus Acidiferrales bacterium]
MNTCSQWRDSLYDFALDTLPAGAARAVEDHLRHCVSCAAVASDLRLRRRQMDAGLAQLFAAAELAPDFRARVLAAAEASRPAAWQPAWSAALAGVALLILAAALFQLPGWRWKATTSAPPHAVRFSDWRAPTDGLLPPASSPLLNSGPRLGEFYFPLDSISASPSQDIGGNDDES